jgi:hypothetical protein
LYPISCDTISSELSFPSLAPKGQEELGEINMRSNISEADLFLPYILSIAGLVPLVRCAGA